jgi:hypothetical protein
VRQTTKEKEKEKMAPKGTLFFFTVSVCHHLLHPSWEQHLLPRTVAQIPLA